MADDSLMALGNAYFLRGQWGDAAYNYGLLIKEYPDSKLQLKAHLFALQANMRRYQGSAYDDTPLKDSAKLAKSTLSQFGNSLGNERQRVVKAEAQIEEEKANRDFIRAEYYEGRHCYGAARLYFNSVIDEFPEHRNGAEGQGGVGKDPQRARRAARTVPVAVRREKAVTDSSPDSRGPTARGTSKNGRPRAVGPRLLDASPLVGVLGVVFLHNLRAFRVLRGLLFALLLLCGCAGYQIGNQVALSAGNPHGVRAGVQVEQFSPQPGRAADRSRGQGDRNHDALQGGRRSPTPIPRFPAPSCKRRRPCWFPISAATPARFRRQLTCRSVGSIAKNMLLREVKTIPLPPRNSRRQRHRRPRAPKSASRSPPPSKRRSAASPSRSSG